MLPRNSPRLPHTSAIEKLAQMAPVPLDAARVSEVGAVRAAFDAVRALPEARQAFQEARGDTDSAMRYVAVSSKLTRLTAMAAAQTTPAAQAQAPTN